VFDLGDALGDASEELVFIAPDGVYAQPFIDRKASNPTRVVTTPSLVVSPEEDDLVAWDFMRQIAPDQPVNLACHLELNRFNGRTTLQLQIIDIETRG
jgi:hypothetical protein